jgi:hypothetical protein
MADLDEIAKLRAEGLTPKSIAKRLRLKQADVTAALQQLAAAVPKELGAFLGAWVSAHWTEGLGFSGQAASWRKYDVADHEHEGAGGIVQVLVTRAGRYDDVVVGGYLCDLWCLGVKDALGPKTMKRHELDGFALRYFQGHEGAGPIPLELAQAIVLGAEAYGRSLGFEPHADYAKVKPLLGAETAPAGITFGREGNPTYIEGPRDDAAAIRAKLGAARVSESNR